MVAAPLQEANSIQVLRIDLRFRISWQTTFFYATLLSLDSSAGYKPSVTRGRWLSRAHL